MLKTVQLINTSAFGNGTVTQVQGNGTVNGITLTGNVTSSGNITLGGTLGSIANSQLSNSSVTIGNTSVSLGSTVTSFGNVTLTNATISSLSTPITTTEGGTGQTSYAVGDLPYYASGSALSKLGIGTSGYVLQSNGSAPTWVNQSTLSVGTATNATNTAITDNTSSSATWYPTIVSATTGNLPQTTSSTKLSFVPSTGTLTATSYGGAWAGSTIGTTYGGTGQTSFTANGVMYASSTSALATGSSFVFDGTNVGIGTNSPSTFGKLSVKDGTINIVSDSVSKRISFWSQGNGNSENAYIQSTNDGGTTNTGEIIFATKNVAATLAECARFTAQGLFKCVGVYNNTVGATNRAVFVDNTGVVGYIASIKKAKINIQDLTDTNWLYDLNPVTFYYRKKDKDNEYTDETDGNIQYGMIAEDVEKVRPDLCVYDEIDGKQELRGIEYSKLIPILLKEIQNLKQEFDLYKTTHL